MNMKLRNFFLTVILFSFLPFMGGCGAMKAYDLVDGASGGAVSKKVGSVVGNGGIGGLFRKATDFVGNVADSITGKKEVQREEAQWQEPQAQPLRKLPMIFPDKRKIRFVGKNYPIESGEEEIPDLNKKVGDKPIKSPPPWGRGTAI